MDNEHEALKAYLASWQKDLLEKLAKVRAIVPDEMSPEERTMRILQDPLDDDYDDSAYGGMR